MFTPVVFDPSKQVSPRVSRNLWAQNQRVSWHGFSQFMIIFVCIYTSLQMTLCMSLQIASQNHHYQFQNHTRGGGPPCIRRPSEAIMMSTHSPVVAINKDTKLAVKACCSWAVKACLDSYSTCEHAWPTRFIFGIKIPWDSYLQCRSSCEGRIPWSHILVACGA